MIFMKKIMSGYMYLVALMLFFLGVLSPLTAQVLDKTVATVRLFKVEQIVVSQIDAQTELWEKRNGKKADDEVKKDLVEAAINDVLILQAAEKKGVSITESEIDRALDMQKQSLGTAVSSAEFQRIVSAQTGIKWSQYRTQVKNRLIQEKYIISQNQNMLEDIPPPTEIELQQAYETYATSFANPAMVRISHIYFDTRQGSQEKKNELKTQAEDFSARIKRRAVSFDDLSKNALDDPSYQAGDIGYLIREERVIQVFGKSFIDSVFALKEQEVSEVLESENGYHIVQVTDKRAPKLLQMDDPIFPGESTTVRDRIVALLENQDKQKIFADAVKKEIDSLRSNADINIYEKNL